MIIVDAGQHKFSHFVVRKAMAHLEHHLTAHGLDEFLKKNCLWIIPLNSWAHLENEVVRISTIVHTQADAGDLGREASTPNDLCGAPVYRMLAGSMGLDKPEADSDVLLVACKETGQEVILRITNLAAESPVAA